MYPIKKRRKKPASQRENLYFLCVNIARNNTNVPKKKKPKSKLSSQLQDKSPIKPLTPNTKNILNILEPIIFPIAKSVRFLKAAITAVVKSPGALDDKYDGKFDA